MIKMLSFSVKKILCFTAIYLLLSNFSSLCYAQEAKKGNEPNKKDTLFYKIPIKYSATKSRVYTITEVADITRKYSDSTVKQYKREIIYYISQKAPDAPQNGFQVINVSVDSLEYKLTDGSKVYEFSSIKNISGSSNFPDIQHTVVLLGRNYDLTYSPYYEITKYEGEDLDWLRDYITGTGNLNLDKMKEFIWLDGISNSRLNHIGDLIKLQIPLVEIQPDSVWYSKFAIQVNNIGFAGNAETRFVSSSDGNYRFEAIPKSITPVNNTVRLYDIVDLAEIKNYYCGGKYTLYINFQGIVNEAIGDFTTDVRYMVKREEIQEHIKSSYRILFINQYSW